MKRTVIINGKNIIELLIDAIRASRKEKNLRSLGGFAASQYELKTFLRLYLAKQARVELEEALGDEDPFVRWCVVKALGQLSSSKELLMSALEDPDDEVQAQAALELGKTSLSSDAVVEALLQKLETGTVRVRAASAVSLPILTGKTFLVGKSNPKKWRSWWQANKEKSRAALGWRGGGALARKIACEATISPRNQSDPRLA